MTGLLPILLLVAVGIGIVLWARAANAVAVLSIDGGKVKLVRGRLSASQRRDLQEAVHLAGVREGRIRVVAKGHDGLDVRLRPHHDSLEQRLRNVVATWGRG